MLPAGNNGNVNSKESAGAILKVKNIRAAEKCLCVLRTGLKLASR